MSHNPFEPHTAPTDDEAQDQGDDLEKLNKAELVARADEAGLATSGTKADLIERIRAG